MITNALETPHKLEQHGMETTNTSLCVSVKYAVDVEGFRASWILDLKKLRSTSIGLCDAGLWDNPFDARLQQTPEL